MMKSVRQIALALAMAGAASMPAFAQTQGYPYQSTRYATPAVLPQYAGYQSLPPVQQPVQQTSGGYLLAARGGEGAALTPAPQPQAAPSVLASPSDVEPLPPPNYGGQSSATPGYSQPLPTQSGGMFMGPPVAGGCQSGNCGAASSGTYAPNGDNIGYGDYAGCGQFMGGCGPTWQVYAGAVFMGRTNNNKTWTTYETGNNPNQLMYFPDPDNGAGPEIAVTRYFGCDRTCGIQGILRRSVQHEQLERHLQRHEPTQHADRPRIRRLRRHAGDQLLR
ncbi:MAG: hypothetical protein QM811_31045 [Pirellulales bacterium]